jgi:isoleucyl-tRNA synthetase
MLRELDRMGRVVIGVSDGSTVELTRDAIDIRLEAKPGWAAAEGTDCVVVLATDLTPELIREGLARDVVRFIQEARKEISCQYTDRIMVEIQSDDPQINTALAENREYIMSETLAMKLVTTNVPDGMTYDLGDGKSLRLRVTVVKK